MIWSDPIFQQSHILPCYMFMTGSVIVACGSDPNHALLLVQGETMIPGPHLHWLVASHRPGAPGTEHQTANGCSSLGRCIRALGFSALLRLALSPSRVHQSWGLWFASKAGTPHDLTGASSFRSIFESRAPVQSWGWLDRSAKWSDHTFSLWHDGNQPQSYYMYYTSFMESLIEWKHGCITI